MAIRRKRKKSCFFTDNKIEHIDYKDEKLLLRFVNVRGKIVPRRMSCTSGSYQSALGVAIKRARIIGLLPFVAETMR